MNDIRILPQQDRAHTKSNVELCGFCVQTMGQLINTLLQVILNGGVLGSCNALCQYAAPFGQIAMMACNLLCDYVGIEAFISLIKKADLNPIWMCEELRLCEIKDCPEGKECVAFTGSPGVQPPTPQLQAPFAFYTQYTVNQEVGAGEILFFLHTAPGSQPPVVEGGNLVDKYPVGVYNMKVNIELKDNNQGDFPVIFRPGVYSMHTYLCNGQCGSHHAHTQLL
eukprot:CAMPEP_0181482320 /NCGR_PEP_ID=MMETSP1110-20121109/44785_1 /TAXON_ID=174948 /ORGANISM="Symbiodinium sp., Strain CCMP421" /LENGTH=223 /DNA_ID=CAMNT_0023607877 /DNA_START=35 /DNA_END=703 /DNA_ORIENTATION=-